MRSPKSVADTGMRFVRQRLKNRPLRRLQKKRLCQGDPTAHQVRCKPYQARARAGRSSVARFFKCNDDYGDFDTQRGQNAHHSHVSYDTPFAL